MRQQDFEAALLDIVVGADRDRLDLLLRADTLRYRQRRLLV